MAAPSAKVVLFDVGNVLVPWNPRNLYRKIFFNSEAIEHFLNHVCTPAWHAEHDRGRPMADNAVPLLNSHPEFAEAIRAWRSRWDEMFGPPIAGAVRLLERLDDAGVPVFALTNFPAEKFDAFVEDHSFMGRFRDVVVSGREKRIKPDRRIYEIAAARMGVADPGEVFFVDDMQTNIDAARAFGFDAERFDGPEALAGQLAARGLLVDDPRSM